VIQKYAEIAPINVGNPAEIRDELKETTQYFQAFATT
jgi:hypothetical protein